MKNRDRVGMSSKRICGGTRTGQGRARCAGKGANGHTFINTSEPGFGNFAVWVMAALRDGEMGVFTDEEMVVNIARMAREPF